MKAGRESSLLGHLHELLLQCWEEGTIIEDMRDAKIVKLCKNNGDRSDCNNYRGISLLSRDWGDWDWDEFGERTPDIF